MEVYGREGLALSDYWAKGMKTYHGFLSHGFPNLFHVGVTQTGWTQHVTYLLEGQAAHIAHIIAAVIARKATAVQPTSEAEASWVAVVSRNSSVTEFFRDCTPGYFNGEGKLDGQSFAEGKYPAGVVAFFDLLASWRQRGRLEGLIVK
jgi:cyclohexanone monooxygenase